MKPETKARVMIDQHLASSGWVLQDLTEINLTAALGVAVREFPTSRGPADYVLFVAGKPVGVVEAKKVGTTLSGVAEQTAKYQEGIPDILPHVPDKPPFAYESTGIETFFRDQRDPQPRSRRVFCFHRPETLAEWIEQGDTLRARLASLPPLITTGLRDCQREAIVNLEQAFAKDRPRSLVQMATGSGKTFLAVSFIYRLLKYAGARRVLFLVDRRTLAKQTLNEFQQYRPPDDGRLFTQIYNVQRMQSNKLDSVSRVCISTIQRVYSMLSNGGEPDEELEDRSTFDVAPADEPPKEVAYNPAAPIETFDFIVTDECHRSIYHLWRQVLEYFDSYLIGLTATPSKQTIGFFDNNLVMEYNHERAVADGVNVGYEVYRIKTRITQEGSKVEAGYYVDKRDRQTRKKRWEQLDDDLVYKPNQLDRDVVAIDQIRTVIRTFRDKLPEIFPDRREEVPKTLVFAKDDNHAEDIVHVIREEFGRGNEFCKKITYKTTGEKPEDLISQFRNTYHPRIAVTVDMVSTGTDIKPLECLLFMRDVRSLVYFDQMKGRGTRTIDQEDLKAVTPGAKDKTHFVIVDAVGVCEGDKTDTRPLERKKSVPLDKLMLSVAMGSRNEDVLTSIAGRLARLDRQLTEPEQERIQAAAGGMVLKTIINHLLDAVDPDQAMALAAARAGAPEPSPEQVKQAWSELAETAAQPFNLPELRNTILEIKRNKEQVIDTVSVDEVLEDGFSPEAREKAQGVVSKFREFIEANRDELTALRIIYGQPYGTRRLTYQAVKELAEAVKRPPYGLSGEAVWRAYQQLDRSRVRGAGPQRLLTDLVALVRFAVGASPVLEPYSDEVERRYAAWLAQQEQAGRGFSPEQRQWLDMIKDHIATSAEATLDDLELSPFDQEGGPFKAAKVFGPDLENILRELNEALAA